MSKDIIEGLKIFGLTMVGLIMIIVSVKMLNSFCLFIGMDEFMSYFIPLMGVLMSVVITVSVVSEQRRKRT